MKITIKGVSFASDNIGWNISGAVTDADVNKAVSIDAAAANTCKLAAEGAEILGRILVVEDRTSQGEGIVCTVEMRGGLEFPYKTGESLAPGDKIVGAGSGEVRKATAGDAVPLLWTVVEVDTANKKVVALKV